MDKNELSRIPDSDVVVSPDNPNDPVVTTDDPNDSATDDAALSRTGYYGSFNERVVRKVHFFKRGNNNDLESSSSMHEKHQPNDTKIEIEPLEEMLGTPFQNIHEPAHQCCIYKVPKDLRSTNSWAYTPQVISIGPFHHGNTELIEMEKQKIRYILEFQKREGAEKLKRFKSFIKDNEQIIRGYYQENSSLTSCKFVNMILRDVVFIIEFFLKNAEPVNEREFDFFLDTPYMRAAITRDLQLFENQLPYVLLTNLFENGAFLNFTKKEYSHHDPFLILSHRFFFEPKGDVFPKPKNKIQYEIQHFTDLIRYFLLMDFLPRDQQQGEHVRDLPIATKLHASGVKFKMGNEGGSSLKISCEYVPHAMRIPGFKGCEIRIPFIKELWLQIPRFEIDDKSECLYRNLTALELCHYPSETHICNFIVLMDFLIDTGKDVDLLVEEGIIVSRLGDNATVATMFHKLGLQITPSPSVYHDICERLKAHYARPWNRTMATLNPVYFRSAVIVLVLTFIQAVCSVLSLL